MILLLPYEGKTIEDVKMVLNSETWNKMVQEMRGFEVDVKLPAFETTTDLLHLKDALREIGIQKAFNPLEADFSALTNESYPFFIGDVLHKAKIKVDETGSEAAAITDISVVTTGINPAKPPADKLACTTTDDGNSADDRQVVGCNWLSTPAAGARDAASASAAESRPAL